MKKIKSDYLIVLMPVIYMAVAIGVVILVSCNGSYPTGSDTMYHIYRGDYVYNSIKSGNWYPIYNNMWYNGVELMRYWAPLAAYFVAFCQFIAGGSQMGGYLIFVGMICFLGAIPWLFIGRKINRPYLGAFMGILWFFMPNNLLALFVEGNLARSLSMVFLPVLIYAVCEYLKCQKISYIPAIMISFIMMVLCHLGYAGMVAIAIIIYCIVYMFQGGNKKAVADIIITVLISFMILGIWMFASLNGGITSLDNSENMSKFFQSIVISINPFERIESNNSNFYFGLAATLLSVYGIFFGYKKTRTGFITGMIILLCTTTAMYPVLKILPGSQYLWMLRFISIALCIILYSFLTWDTLKKPLVILFCILLVADTIPSLTMIYGTHDGTKAEDRLNARQEATLIKKAQQITKQRLALMDASSMGATGAWLVSDWNEATAATFGAGWEAANTSVNIENLNKSMASGKFYYMFDRCVELGNDTVLVQLSQLEKSDDSIVKLDKAAKASGYSVADENAGYRLYHMDTPSDNWGIISRYKAIGIGSGATNISLQFPAVEQTQSYNINDYTFEQLSEYDEVFLDGFTYDDKETAENLIIRLSESGVKVIIFADGMPQDSTNHNQSFLGVTCNPITFKNGYPEMDTRIGKVYADMFPQGHTTWDTVYIDGLDNTWGTVNDNGFDLDFYGTVKNDNIIMCGLNLTYFYGLTNDKTVERLLENMTSLTSEMLPERKLVALEVKYDSDKITISSDSDNVNTTIAYHDIFNASQHIEKKNNLTYVDKGTTIIRLEIPYLWQGALISVAGLILAGIWINALRKRLNSPDKQKQPLVEE